MRVMAVGLDAADAAVVRRWAAEGHLPTLARLMEEGVCAPLRTPPGMADDAVWSSFSTGLWPIDHGRFDYRAIVPGHYEPVRFRNDMYVHHPFWEALDRAGRRCVVLDVPKSPQASLRHGIEVNNFRVHGIDGPLMSRPSEIASELAARFSDDPTDRPEGDHSCAQGSFDTPEQRSAFIDLVRQSVADKTRVALELLDTACDLFLVVFKEAHCAGHKLWPPGPEMLAVYTDLDRSLGELVARAGEDTTVMVFTALGMGPNHHANDVLDSLVRRVERRVLGVSGTLRSASTSLGRRLRAHVHGAAARPSAGDRLASVVPHNEISGAIRVNLAGRDAAGRVQPGRDHRTLCDLIEAEVRLLVDAETGTPVVRDVVRLDLQHGVSRELLPDLLVVWERTRPITAVSTPTLGTVHLHHAGDSPGNHVEGGFVVASRPASGHRPCVDLGAASFDIVDLAPTIAAMLGVDLADSAGRPIDGVVALGDVP